LFKMQSSLVTFVSIVRRVPTSTNLRALKLCFPRTTKRTFYTVKTEFPPLVSTKWLQGQLERKNVKIVDGSWHHDDKRDATKEFAQARIPGSMFFDINEIRDHNSKHPRMLPSAQDFEVHMSQLGLTNDDLIVVYEQDGVFCAPRVWYMLKTFGAKNVAILDGGFKTWKKEARPIEEGPMTGAYHSEKKAFSAKKNSKSIATVKDIQRIIYGVDECQLVDARASDRFLGLVEDPYKELLGTQPGHVPGAINLPFKKLLVEDGLRYKPVNDLRKVFKDHNVDINKPIIAMCGSGVTACIINFGMHLVQWEDYRGDLNLFPPLRMYNGSWAEWGSRKDLPRVSADLDGKK